MPRSNNDQYSDRETERRATDALRRALATPYKPQSDMKVGKRKATAKPTKKPNPKGR